MGEFCLVIVVLILSTLPKQRLTITYGVFGLVLLQVYVSYNSNNSPDFVNTGKNILVPLVMSPVSMPAGC